MAQVQAIRVRLKAGSTARVVEFLRSLRDRDDEVQEALAAENIELESLFLERGDDGDFLFFYTRAEDLQRAAAAFQSSQRPIDVETRALIADTWVEATALEPVVDLVRGDRAAS